MGNERSSLSSADPLKYHLNMFAVPAGCMLGLQAASTASCKHRSSAFVIVNTASDLSAVHTTSLLRKRDAKTFRVTCLKKSGANVRWVGAPTRIVSSRIQP